MIKSKILKGTFILTLAGFLTRILGFFYKIYLSNILGPENLGIYQLIFPIYGLFFTLYASGIQTAISKLVAEAPHKKILYKGFLLSFALALCCSIFLYFNASFISNSIIKEPRCQASLRLLSLVFPFCSITSCANGFYFGLKETLVPAISQLLEQIVRIFFSYGILFFIFPASKNISCEFAVLAIALGELFSALYVLCSLFFKKTPIHIAIPSHIYKKILLFTLPLTATHLIISILHSTESILIPNLLKQFGCTTKEALCIYGVLTGMSMSLLMFPSTITNSLAVLLLPSISEANATENHAYISKTTEQTIKYSLLIGLFCSFVFFLFGNELGYLFFKNKLAGIYLKSLSWLCPLLYLGTTSSSILNGLNMISRTFYITITSLFLRVLLIILLIPVKGIFGYFISLLLSQLLLTLLSIHLLRKKINFTFDSYCWIVKPILSLTLIGFFVIRFWFYICTCLSLSKLLLLCICCSVYFVLYILSLKLLRILS